MTQLILLLQFFSFFALLAVANCGVVPVAYEQPAYTTYSHAAPVVHHAPIVHAPGK